MVKCRGILPPGVDEKDLVNRVVGATPTHEVVIGQVFELSEEQTQGEHPWFEILEGSAEAPAVQAADGLTFASAKGQFRPVEEDELPV